MPLKRLLLLGLFVLKRLVLTLVSALEGPAEIAWLQSVRAALLRLIGCRIGRCGQIGRSLFVHDGRRLRIGDRCRIGSFAQLWDFCPISIGDDLLASHNLVLISASHELDRARSNCAGPIVIGNHVWLGINVTIVGPVIIGDHVIVGANSLVTCDLPSNAVYGGSPARRLKILEVQA